MKQIITTLTAVVLFIVGIIYFVQCTRPRIKNNSKDQTIIVTTQKGMVDTFEVNAARIWLSEGDLMYQNDTDYFHGNYKVIASGVYKFEVEQ